jgi:hypothetical protein
MQIAEDKTIDKTRNGIIILIGVYIHVFFGKNVFMNEVFTENLSA